MRPLPWPVARAVVALSALAGAVAGGGAATGPAPLPVRATVTEVAAAAPDDVTPRVIRTLSRERREERARLARSSSHRNQARHAAALSASHRRAARALSGAAPHGVPAILRRVARAYDDLAAAARGGDRAAYAAAATRIAAGDRALRHRLTG